MDNAARRTARGERARSGAARALARFEVRGLDADRALIRALARRLAEDGPEAARLRSTVAEAVAGGPHAPSPEPLRKGGLLAALRASPLVGSGIDLSRPRVEPRDIDL